MLLNSFPHMMMIITTQPAMSFPVIPHRHADHRLSKRQAEATAAVTTNNKLSTGGGGKGMNWFYELEQEVREYELDQFGVVNNAVYSNYCEYGTYKLLDKIGFEPDLKLAISQVAVNYISPLKRKDRYMLKLKMHDYSTTRLYFENEIVRLPDHKVILRGNATLVLLNERLRPSRITPSMLTKLHQFLLTHTNTLHCV